MNIFSSFKLKIYRQARDLSKTKRIRAPSVGHLKDLISLNTVPEHSWVDFRRCLDFLNLHNVTVSKAPEPTIAQ